MHPLWCVHRLSSDSWLLGPATTATHKTPFPLFRGSCVGQVLDGPTLAGIYSGNITSWRDPAILGLNNGLALPDQNITMGFLSNDTTGVTTNVFVRALSAFNPAFAAAYKDAGGFEGLPPYLEGRAVPLDGDAVRLQFAQVPALCSLAPTS